MCAGNCFISERDLGRVAQKDRLSLIILYHWTMLNELTQWTATMFLVFAFFFTLPAKQFDGCMPDGVQGDEHVANKSVTVKQTLTKLKARCRKGKLVDSRGKEIYFYRLKGCWGNPPANYGAILEQQGLELQRLRKRYSVIEISCAPDGDLRKIS